MLEQKRAAERIAADGHRRVLDWGCGRGQMTRLLLDAGLEVEALEYRPGAPDALVPLEYFPGLRTHVASDPVHLPYGDDEFDAVLSFGVLEHVQDPDGSLEEIRRVLRAGGCLYVYKLPNRRSYLEWMARRLHLAYYHGRLPNDRLYDPNEARTLLERHGFQVARLRYANMLPLTLGGPDLSKLAPGVWYANKALERIPGLRSLATNVELLGQV
jgi:ubiquinone/menaquinone biosynthesis C-methylase UbiE